MDVMQLRRNLLMQKVGGGGLPAAYQQVEWIKSDGNQYIDTGIVFNTGIKIIADMGWTQKSGCLFGARKDTGATRFVVTYYQGIDFGYGSDHLSGVEPVIDTIYNLIFDTSGGLVHFTVDSSTQTYTNAVNNTDTTGYIFAYHRGNDDSVQSKSKSIFKSMTIENAYGVKLFDGIPCYRKSDNEIGIYDMASETFLTNLGTGTFTKGNDI